MKPNFFRFHTFLAALFLFTHVQAQIKVTEFNKKTERNTLVEVYVPTQRLNKEQIVTSLKKNRELLNPMGGYISDHWEDWNSSTVLDDRLNTNTGTLFYYKDIVKDTIRLCKRDKKWFEVTVPVSKVRGKNVKSFWIYFYSFEPAREFVEIIYYIQQYNDSIENSELAEFQKTAKIYREEVTIPAVTEEQRKYIVQANAMNQKKEYGKAIEFYNKSLEISPVSYPAAYYNLAILFTQENNFRKAIFNMKKYLLLVPEAPDARAAQDKIYEWEAEH